MVKLIVVKKPWGEEHLWAMTPFYAGKFLIIKKGHQLSLQHHENKIETIHILEGTLALIAASTMEEAIKMEPLILKKGDSYHIEAKIIHRMIAIDDVKIVEVSTAELDDVVRHLDDYGRIA